MPLNESQAKALREAADAAVLCEVHTQCPALLSICQWALESGWGKHQPGNNCFGIKHYVGAYGKQDLLTTEYLRGQKVTIPQAFATFATLYDCFEKHAELITRNQRYQPAFRVYLIDHDIERLVRGIAKIYATDPNYATEILQIMSMPEVLTAVGDAWQRISPDSQEAVA